MVKRTDSLRRDDGFEYCTFHNKSTIGEEGNEKPPHKIHFPRIDITALSLVSAKLEIEYATQCMSCLYVFMIYVVVLHYTMACVLHVLPSFQRLMLVPEAYRALNFSLL